MTVHKYVFGEGGTGVRILLAIYHYLSSKTYAGKGADDNWKLIYEAMDAGSEEVEDLLRLIELDRTLNFRGPSCSFTFLKVAESLRNALDVKTLNIRKTAPEWYQNELLLTKKQLSDDLLGGYYRDLTLGSLVSGMAVRQALQTEEDKAAGFMAIVSDVVASNNTYQVRVVFAGSAVGGEGRTNLCSHPALLKELCIDKVKEDLKLSHEQAKLYVDNILKIAVVMVASPFRFPSVQGLDQDTAGLVAGTLTNYPADCAEAVNLLYLLDHDMCPIQASEASVSGRQHKHAHAIELVAVAAIDDFFKRSSERASKKQCPVIPHYSMPKHGAHTNWENLGLPHEYREHLTARLRFDAALFYWVRPQLLVTPEEKAAGKMHGSEILLNMYNVTGKQVEDEVMDFDDEVLFPLRALLEKEQMYLEYIIDISLTGRNWETGQDPASGCGTTLFDVQQIIDLLQNPDIVRVGKMTGYNLDDLSQCPKDPVSGKQEDNLYATKLTMDGLRTKVLRQRGRKSFRTVLGTIYDTCSSTKKEKKYGIF